LRDTNLKLKGLIGWLDLSELNFKNGKYFGPEAARILYQYADLGEKQLLDVLIPYDQTQLIVIIGFV